MPGTNPQRKLTRLLLFPRFLLGYASQSQGFPSRVRVGATSSCGSGKFPMGVRCPAQAHGARGPWRAADSPVSGGEREKQEERHDEGLQQRNRRGSGGAGARLLGLCCLASDTRGTWLVRYFLAGRSADCDQRVLMKFQIFLCLRYFPPRESLQHGIERIGAGHRRWSLRSTFAAGASYDAMSLHQGGKQASARVRGVGGAALTVFCLAMLRDVDWVPSVSLVGPAMGPGMHKLRILRERCHNWPAQSGVDLTRSDKDSTRAGAGGASRKLD